jgi:D5 N terminal like
VTDKTPPQSTVEDSNVPVDQIFREPSTPMVAAVRAFSHIARTGEIPDDELKDTDAALAAEFSVAYADRLQFDYRRKDWMVWERGVFRQQSSGDALRALQGWAETRAFEQVARAATARDLDAVRRIVRRALGAQALKRLLELSSAQILLANSGDQWDADPFLLVTADGTAIDLKPGGARPATPEDRARWTVAFPGIHLHDVTRSGRLSCLSATTIWSSSRSCRKRSDTRPLATRGNRSSFN